MRTYDEIVQFILEIPKFTTKNKLDHTEKLLALLGNPQERFKVVHVAGSNGKGSVCACIDSVLRQAGIKTGLFTSPHLVHIEERFALEGKPCDRNIFVNAANRVAKAADTLVQKGLPYPTFFEYIFAVGMVIFAEQKVEYAVVETGLGGRLDATNVVKYPLLTVITSISLEHTEILGDTIAKIASEKAGIIKEHVPVVYDASLADVRSVIEDFALRLQCPRYPVFAKNIKILLNTGKKIAFSYDSGYDVTELEIPFGAPYQARNAALALQAVNYIAELEGISGDKIRQGFAQVRWKGRMQQVLPEVYFDGAHNPSGIENFLEAAGQITNRKAVLLFSMVKEKDYQSAAALLLAAGNWEEVILTTIPGMRGMDAEVLADVFAQKAKEHHSRTKITAKREWKAAYVYALSIKKPGQVLFCAGSLYLIGELEQIAGGMS
ncbi:bifunctional folylpolyglutamate synthase/dihydrofolate synthase [Lachnospiraceae bacterium]|nr:bifunctional folylpolyglutamate synthase/dihydrofolate synthase [Lachnospiraceae bacterium]